MTKRRKRSKGRALGREAALVVVTCILLLAAHAPVAGQIPVLPTADQMGGASSARFESWKLFEEGGEKEWPLQSFHEDSVQAATSELLKLKRSEGYPFARLDSVSIRKRPEDGTTESIGLFIQRGRRLLIKDIQVTGLRATSKETLLRDFDSRPGAALDPDVLEDDLSRLLDRYDQLGYVLAEARVDEIAVDEVEPAGFVVGVTVVEGPSPDLASIEVDGLTRTKPSFVSKISGLKQGRPLTGYDPDEIRRRLMETGLFREIEAVQLKIEPGEEAIVRVKGIEEAPGAFDAVVGFLPSTQADQRGSVVGNINLLLKHLFGGGREFLFRFNRLPGSVTRFEAKASDPFVAGYPIRVEVGFDGYQQDVVFGKQRFYLETGYRLREGLEAFVSYSSESTRPGFDSTVVDFVPPSSVRFLGVGFRARRVDRILNPRSGWEIVLNAESGNKNRDLFDNAEPGEPESLAQQRATLFSRFYIPVFGRHVVALGGEASLLASERYDDSDLFRLGGANTLRGYNEEQFRGSMVARGLVEWRFLLDRTSFLFLFSDLGYHQRPETPLTDAATGIDPRVASGFHPGYGFGLQFGAGAGMFSLSLALNPSDGLGGKVHVGILLGI